MRRWTMPACLCLAAVGASLLLVPGSATDSPVGREEVVFWHFWGGADRNVVDEAVRRFNASQQSYHVRAIAIPGNNLDVKLFLSITGGDPPDLVIQDDPIVADWAARGALTALDDVASEQEVERLKGWLVPAARRMGLYGGRLYAVCNGLDVRALYFNKSMLDEIGAKPPQSIADLDRIAEALTKRDENGRLLRAGFLPNPKRFMAWGTVFGGDFFDEQTGQVTADSPANTRALEWMSSYRQKHGRANISEFRAADPSLPGQMFPLLAGRYAMAMDGQWRVRDIQKAQQQWRQNGETPKEFGVCPLPAPSGGREKAGWVNGNRFLIPRGANNPKGAWQFIKFWVGFDSSTGEAARICREGGWIPVAKAVMEDADFQSFLQENDLFAEFVRLAAETNQIPTPNIRGALFLQREVEGMAAQALLGEDPPPVKKLLSVRSDRIQSFLDSRNEQTHATAE